VKTSCKYEWVWTFKQKINFSWLQRRRGEIEKKRIKIFNVHLQNHNWAHDSFFGERARPEQSWVEVKLKRKRI
jgi:hypothetical protein